LLQVRYHRLYVRHQKGFDRHQKGFARHQKGFVRHQKGFVRHQKGFARHQKGFARHQKGFARHHKAKVRQNPGGFGQKKAAKQAENEGFNLKLPKRDENGLRAMRVGAVSSAIAVGVYLLRVAHLEASLASIGCRLFFLS
jgi:hypothetical protein